MPVCQTCCAMSPDISKGISAYPRYARRGASSRLRFYAFADDLAKATGRPVTFHPLFDDDYLDRLYHGRGRSLLGVMRAYVRRFWDILNDTNDVIWLEKELFPYMPYALERWLLKDKKVILDLDDAVFHSYDQHRLPAVRRLLGNKIAWLMQDAKPVMAGSPYLLEYAQMVTPDAHLIPTVINGDDYKPAPLPKKLTLGWIGTPMTVHYLKPWQEALRELSVQGIALHIIGMESPPTGFEFARAIPWRESLEIAALNDISIGLMPLPDQPWERGKCGYKLIQYMALGRAVIASPVGVNVSLVEESGAGFLCADPQELRNHILELAQNPKQLAQLGKKGADFAHSHLTQKIMTKKIIKVIKNSI